ncbi:MAG: hypothetical protein ABI056_06190, partial [Caulobacteraceae bacterium]
MDTALAATIAASLLGFSSIAAAETNLGCPKDPRMDSYKLVDVLGRKGATVVSSAAAEDWRTNRNLSELMTPDTTFNLGAGDVGRPLGVGRSGARLLAATQRADEY